MQNVYNYYFWTVLSRTFFVRELSKTNINVIGIGRKNEIGVYSKYGTKYTAENKDEILNIVENVIYKHNEKPKGIITSATFLTMFIDEFPEIFEKLDVIGHEIDTLKIFEDKIASYKLLNDYNIRSPKTYLLSEAPNILESDFPLILKWRSTELNIKKRVIKKTKIIRNKEELTNQVTRQNVSNKLILQKFIDGVHSREYGYGGYFENGKEVIGIFMNGLRQYPTGIYTIAREVEDSCTVKIKQKLLLMLESINYSGFIHFDIKVDPVNKEFFVLDINPRPWNSIKILKAKYPNFIDIFLKREVPVVNYCTVQWIDLCTDFVSIFKKGIKNKSIKSIYRDYYEYLKFDTIFNVFEYHDIKPLMGVLKVGFKKFLERINKIRLKLMGSD